MTLADPTTGPATGPATGPGAGADRLEAARRLSNQRMATTRVEGTFGLDIEELTGERLRVTAPLPLRDGRPDPLGTLALACVLCDTGAGLASAIGLAFGEGGATVELRMDHVRAPSPGARRLQVVSRQLHVVADAGVAESELSDDLGNVLIRARGHFARQFTGSAFDGLPPGEERRGSVLRLCDALALDPAADPADREVEVAEVLANSRGHLHGGLVFALAGQVQRTVRAADLSPGAPPPTLLSMQVDFLRPAICDGTPLVFRTGYVRRGRRFSTLRTEVLRADGRVAEVATGLWRTGD